MNELTKKSIMGRVLGGNNNSPKDVADQFIQIHHIFMKEYGWIHPDVFYSLPIDFINNMVKEINNSRKEENKKNKKKGRKR